MLSLPSYFRIFVVMFHNVRIGMKVEISRKNGNLYTGKVKWKGYVTGRTGEWIGIELDVPGKQQLCEA